MAELPDDVVKEILIRLPVKSLLRFRSVSKTWCALIDSSNLIKRHLIHSIQTKTNHSLILQSHNLLLSTGLYSLNQTLELNHPINFQTQISEAMLLGSCNGLLCLLYDDFDENLFGNFASDVIVLWNAATRKHVKLPAPNLESHLTEDIDLVPYKVYGFGYDSVSNDYKVVMIIQHSVSGSHQSESQVYNLRSNTWRRIQDLPYLLCSYEGGLLACGALHWALSSESFGFQPPFVAAFDLVTEEYSLITLPDFRDDVALHLYVAKLGGCLSIVFSYVQVCVFDVWVMKEYGVKESWTKLLTVSGSMLNISIEFVIPLAYSKSGNEVLMTRNDEELFWYDLENMTLRFADVCDLQKGFNPTISMESLVSLGEYAEMDDNEHDWNIESEEIDLDGEKEIYHGARMRTLASKMDNFLVA